MKQAPFIKFISYLQIIGIILVVLGHSFHEYPDGMYGNSFIVYRLIYTFHMPLFLFVSGFLLLYTTEICRSDHTFSGFALQKAKRLLLPMVVLTAVTFVPRCLLSDMADETMELNARNFFLSFFDLSHLPIPFFWYIHVNFLLLCAVFLLVQLLKKTGIRPVVTLLVIFTILLLFALSPLQATTFFSISKLKTHGIFFILGALYALCADRIDRRIPWADIRVFAVFTALWLITFRAFEHNGAVCLCSLMGICACISLARIMVKRRLTFLDHLSGANFLIFLFSWYLNIGFQQVLAHFVSLPWYVHTLLSLFSGIYVPWLGYKYLEKHQNSRWIRFTSALLGQKFTPQKI